MPRYEYYVRSKTFAEVCKCSLEVFLNGKAESGWRLVAIVPAEGNKDMQIILEREKKEQMG